MIDGGVGDRIDRGSWNGQQQQHSKKKKTLQDHRQASQTSGHGGNGREWTVEHAAFPLTDSNLNPESWAPKSWAPKSLMEPEFVCLGIQH